MNQREIKLEDLQIVGALMMEAFDECAAFICVVNDFYGLFEADGDEDAEDDDERCTKNSRLVIGACWGGWISIIGAPVE
ncbi:MAG: hypothetical protein WB622_02125 [Acidobacteriaceae bacterium]